jgi:hypothetical protein
MQRKHFDILVSAVGLLLAIVLVVFGFYFKGRYDFANGTVQTQLEEQKISFPPAEALSDEEKAQPNLADYAGEAVDDGEAAKVYANEYINVHLQSVTDDESLQGLTYAELGAIERQDPPPDNIDEVREVRETVFKGETLRGLLLTTYGFWQFGQEALLAMWVSFIAAGLLLVFSALGFWHALRTPKEATI